MAILGSLIVELKASTASFIDGMTGASKTARATALEIESSLGALGGFAQTALAPLGAFGNYIGQTLGMIGTTAGGASRSLAAMAGGASGLTVGLGLAGGAITAVAVGSLGLAAHAAKSAAELDELSQRTGVSVEALSGFAYVAHQTGISSETMEKGLERLSKSAFAAATAPASAVNAYTRLGISVKDSAGNIRPVQDILVDLAAKFSAMPDGVTKTAVAMQLFGRGGAALIPLLNEGSDGLRTMLGHARDLGVVIDSQTAAAAHAFERSLYDLQAAGQGLTNRLMVELLPALLTVTKELNEGLADKRSSLNNVIEGVVWLTKAFLGVGETIWSVLKQIGSFVGYTIAGILEIVDTASQVNERLDTGDFSGALQAAKDGKDRMLGIWRGFADESKAIWADNRKFIEGVFSKDLPAETKRTGGKGGGLDTGADAVDKRAAAIRKLVAELETAAAAELAVAAASSESAAAQRFAAAAGEADQIITRLTAEANRTTGAEREKLLGIIRQETTAIRALTAEKSVAKDAAAINAQLRKESESYQEQIDSLRALAVAYGQGSAAVAEAEIQGKLKADRLEVERLQEEYGRLAATEGVSSKAIVTIAGALAAARGRLAEHHDQLVAIRDTKLDVELQNQAAAMAGQLPYLAALDSAYLESADAVREAQVALAVYNWQLAHPGATPDQIAQQTAALREQSDVAYTGALMQKAAQYDLGVQRRNEITELERVRAILVATGHDTITVDAAMYDANQKWVRQWDEAAFKVGTFGEKARAVLNEIVLEGRQAGEKIARAILGAYDQLTDELAKLATGQKADFGKVFQNLAQQITKAEIQKGIGSLTEKMGIHIPGLGAKADGSASNPFHVIVEKGGVGALAGAAAGGKGGGFLGDLFGGFMAEGGNVEPGKAYVVGDKGRPEWFVPRTPGAIAPRLTAGGARSTSIVNNFHGVENFDLFRRSSTQIMGQFHRQAAIAFARG